MSKSLAEEMGHGASQMNPMFQTEFSEGGSDIGIFFDAPEEDEAMAPMPQTDCDPEAAPLPMLPPCLVMPEKFERGEAVLRQRLRSV
jgi:hypothetical protein